MGFILQSVSLCVGSRVGGCVLRMSTTLPTSTMSTQQVLSTTTTTTPATPTACVSDSVGDILSSISLQRSDKVTLMSEIRIYYRRRMSPSRNGKYTL